MPPIDSLRDLGSNVSGLDWLLFVNPDIEACSHGGTDPAIVEWTMCKKTIGHSYDSCTYKSHQISNNRS